MPVIPYGVGSSLEGHLLAVQGGVSVDLSRMTAIVQLNPEDLTVTVQAGVTREQLNQAIRDQGLFFPIDPGANATLGGMAATRASGTNAVRYGTMRENVLGLTVVTAAGEVIRTGTRAKKSSAGYDLTRLFVGSEGTLGVMTEVTLKLYPLPEAVSAAICHFPSIDAAVRATIQIIQMGVPIARCELLDVNAVRARQCAEPARAARVADAADGVPRQRRRRAGAGRDRAGHRRRAGRRGLRVGQHARGTHAAVDGAPQGLLRRHADATRAAARVTTDTCVPISRLAEIIEPSVAEADASGLPYYIVGHVGDGNFHLAYLVKEGDAEAARHWPRRLSLRMVQRAIALEGTCTGEHGIGLHKMGFLVDEAGAGSVAMMRSIKHALDPKNIMNPGKIFALVATRGSTSVAPSHPAASSLRGAGTVQRLLTSPLAFDAFQVHAEAPQPRHVLEHLLVALSCSGRSLCWKWRSVSERSPRRLTFQTWMLGSREPRSYWRDRLSRTRAVAGLVVDGADLELALLLVVGDREQAQVAHQLRAQVLADEALVLEVAHRLVERRQPGRAGDVGEPGAVFVGGLLADALDVGVHREAQRIRVDAAVAPGAPPAAGRSRWCATSATRSSRRRSGSRRRTSC